MAVTAEKVVVELEAAHEQFVRDTQAAADAFDKSMESLGASAETAEKKIKDSLGSAGKAALEMAFKTFQKGGKDAEANFAAAIDGIVRATGAGEKEIRAHLDKIIEEMKGKGKEAGKAGEDWGDKFTVGFLKKVLASVLGGAFLAAIVNDAKAMGDLEDAARRASLSLEKMQEILYTVRREGLGEAQAVKDIQQLTKLIADAADNPRNSLRRLFEVNGITIGGKDVNAVMTDLARLMQDAPEGMKTKIQELSGLSEKWIAVLEKGPEEFEKMQQKARDAGAVLDTVAFRKAEEFRNAWNEATTKWGDTMRGTINDLIPALNQLITLALQFGSLLGKSLTALGNVAGMLKNDIFNGGDLEALSNRQLEYMKGLATLGKNQQRIDEIDRLLAARNSSSDFGLPGQIYSPTRAPTGTNQTRLPGPYRSGRGDADKDPAEDALRRKIALLEAEARTIGETYFQRDALKAQTELLAAAYKAGLQPSQELTDHTRRLGEEYALAAEKVRMAKDQWQAANELAKTFGNAAISGIEGLISGTKTLNQALSETLRTLGNMALKAALLGEGPLAAFFGTKSASPGGTGGLFGGLAGLLFGGFRASGGPVSAGKSYVVGEKGVEVFTPSVAGFISPNGKGGGGGSNVTMFNDFRDASAPAIAAIMNRIDRMERSFSDNVARSNNYNGQSNPWGGPA